MRVSKTTQPIPTTVDTAAKAAQDKKSDAKPSFNMDAFVSSQRDPDKDVGTGTSFGTGFRSSGRR